MKRNRNSIKHVRRTVATPRLKPDPHANGVMVNGHNGHSENPFTAKRSLLDHQSIVRLENHWSRDARWQGIKRPYTPEKVLRLRGTMFVEHTIADRMAHKLWD